MAYTILNTCIACDLCVDQCPISAISPGDPVYVIDDTCCDFAECVVVCPVDAIVPLESTETGLRLDIQPSPRQPDSGA